MLSIVLNSEGAIEVNIGIVRAFAAIRRYALTYTELSQRLTELEIRSKDFEKARHCYCKIEKPKRIGKNGDGSAQKSSDFRKKR